MKKWQWISLAAVFLVTVVASFFDPTGETPAFFYAFFGFVGCLFLLFLTKVVGKKVLARKENYYDVP